MVSVLPSHTRNTHPTMYASTAQPTTSHLPIVIPTATARTQTVLHNEMPNSISHRTVPLEPFIVRSYNDGSNLRMCARDAAVSMPFGVSKY